MLYKHRINNDGKMVWKFALVSPFLYVVFIPVVILDFFLELYHRIGFPLLGMKQLNRSDYIRMDRWKLPYLPLWDKINCWYCEYVNGFFAYAVAIAGATELYWCGIKHKSGGGFQEPENQKEYLPYGDAKALHEFEFGKK